MGKSNRLKIPITIEANAKENKELDLETDLNTVAPSNFKI